MNVRRKYKGRHRIFKTKAGLTRIVSAILTVTLTCMMFSIAPIGAFGAENNQDSASTTASTTEGVFDSSVSDVAIQLENSESLASAQDVPKVESDIAIQFQKKETLTSEQVAPEAEADFALQLQENELLLSAQEVSEDEAVINKTIQPFASDPTFKVENGTGIQGNTIRVPVTLSQNLGIEGGTFTVNYPDTALAFTGVEAGSLLGPRAVLAMNPVTNKVTFSNILSDITGNGVIFYLVFDIKAGIPDGSANVSLTLNGNIINFAGSTILVNLASGTVTYSTPLPPPPPTPPTQPTPQPVVTTGAGTVFGTAVADVADDTPETAIITSTPTPLIDTPTDSNQTIADPTTPLAGGSDAHWALFNLLLAGLGCLIAIITIVVRRSSNSSKISEDNSQSNRFVWRVLSIVAAVKS